MVVIKISEVPNNKESLRKRVRKDWRIDKNRLYNQDTVVALYKGEVVQVYKILSYDDSPDCEGRIAFELEEIESNLKGKKVDYRTANPCTIAETLNLK